MSRRPLQMAENNQRQSCVDRFISSFAYVRELDELFRIVLKNSKVAGGHSRVNPVLLRAAKRPILTGFRNRYEKVH